MLAIVAALLIGTMMLELLGADPLQAYLALAKGAFGSTNALADTLVKSTPLLFVGIGICIAYRGGVTNIGGEGQFVIGALTATVVAMALSHAPAWLAIPFSLTAGCLGGAFWGSIAGVLKARFGVNEVLSTVMLNQIAVQFMNFLLRGPLMDPAQITSGMRIPQTQRLATAFDLPRLVPTRLHAGFGLAIFLAVVTYVLLWRTTLGFRIRAVGLNPNASRYAGISVSRYQALAIALSGALAGLAGAVEVLGMSHRMFTDGSATGFTGNAGFNGIVTALFGGLHPLGTIPASILFGALLVGAQSLQRTAQVPTALVVTLNGLIVLFVVGSRTWSRKRSSRRLAAEPGLTGAPPLFPPEAQGVRR